MVTNEQFYRREFPHKRSFALVDLDALTENVRLMRESLPAGKKLCAVIKADAYGHGALPCAKALSGLADYFAVAAAEEGAYLREGGIREPILVLGAVHPHEYETVLLYGLTAAVSDPVSARQLSEEAKRLLSEADQKNASAAGTEAPSAQGSGSGFSGKAHVHIAVDTGMSRIGLMPDENGLSALTEIASLPYLSVDGIFTHFATADETDREKTKLQLSKFSEFLKRAEEAGIKTGLRHCANSAGILRALGTEGFDMVRAGIAMYGIYPSEETERTLKLRPVMQLKSHLSFVKEIEAGAEVSYGGIYQAERRMRVGTVSAGYADGYPRSVSGRGMEVLICGRRCPVIGRVCMDQFMVDLTPVPQAEAGMLVTLFGRDGGEEITLYELTEKSGGFHYELLCNVNKRVPRAYIKDGALVF